MSSKTYSVYFLTLLIGSTLCVIPEGEYQIGPVFGPGSRFFGGNKYFEALFDKGPISKPLLAKKVLLGVGAVGAGALAAGGAALLAKKYHENHPGGSYGGGWTGQYNDVNSGGYYGSGGSSAGGEYSQGYYGSGVSFPVTNDYQIPSTQYGYPSSQQGGYNYQDQSSYAQQGDGYYGNYGWSQ